MARVSKLSSVSSLLNNWLLNRLGLLLHHYAWLISCITNSCIQFTNALANLYIPTQMIVELNCDYVLVFKASKTNSTEFLLAKSSHSNGGVGGVAQNRWASIQRLEWSVTRARKNGCLLLLWGSGQGKIFERTILSWIQNSACWPGGQLQQKELDSSKWTTVQFSLHKSITSSPPGIN